MYRNNLTIKLTKITVDILFYLGIVCTACVPFGIPKIIKYLQFKDSFIIPSVIVLLLSGLCAIFILYQLKTIFKTITGGNPFVIKNVYTLSKIAIASFIVSIIYVFKLFYWFTFATIVIIIVFIVAGLFCLTLKDLFNQAIQYKEDNDLTI